LPCPKKRSPFQIEYGKQKKEHPTVPAKYVKQITIDHLGLKKKGKRSYG
jgi:hypothetical protein